MAGVSKLTETDLHQYFCSFSLEHNLSLLEDENKKTELEHYLFNGQTINVYVNEFWTSRQRRASSIHEISYRACFKPQLPRFFINLLSNKDDVVYDPFMGRGTTLVEAALLGRNVIGNDINPLSKVLTQPRLNIPNYDDVINRLDNIPINNNIRADIDLSMFYHPATEAEIVSLRNYLQGRLVQGLTDHVDDWIRMVATNRLTGHSPGFLSVYTLPPNQAVSPSRQLEINKKRNQKPTYRKVKELVLKKTKYLLAGMSMVETAKINTMGKKALLLDEDARYTKPIKDGTVQLTVTSPPFLDIVQYSKDNWLRCWFNHIDEKKVEKEMTIARSLNEWSSVMGDVFHELYRITVKGGWVAFEVGEVRKGKVRLEEQVIPLGTDAGFNCIGVLVNKQLFTKTSNIWGINNNKSGTNTNRIVLFKKTD